MPWDKRSRQEKGLGSAWQRLRLLILERDCWICQCPRCLGGKLRLRSAGEVDHIVPRGKGGGDEWTNLRSVNVECHRRITAEQNGAKKRRGFDVDGNPYDV